MLPDRDLPEGMTISKIIQEILNKSAGRLSHASLARHLDVSQQTIWRWKNGQSLPKPHFQTKLIALWRHRDKLEMLVLSEARHSRRFGWCPKLKPPSHR